MVARGELLPRWTVFVDNRTTRALRGSTCFPLRMTGLSGTCWCCAAGSPATRASARGCPSSRHPAGEVEIEEDRPARPRARARARRTAPPARRTGCGRTPTWPRSRAGRAWRCSRWWWCARRSPRDRRGRAGRRARARLAGSGQWRREAPRLCVPVVRWPCSRRGSGPLRAVWKKEGRKLTTHSTDAGDDGGRGPASTGAGFGRRRNVARERGAQKMLAILLVLRAGDRLVLHLLRRPP